MKKNLLMGMYILIISISFCVHGIAEGNQQKVMQTKQISKTQNLPDLTVKLEVKAEKHGESYAVTPRYIVTNNGMAVARNFKVVLYHLSRSSSKARIKSVLWTTNTVTALGAKLNWTFDFNPINTAVWHSAKGGQVGFRVMADSEKKVTETKEDNNTVQKMWPLRFRVIKKK